MKTQLACLFSLTLSAALPLVAGTLLRQSFETADWPGKSTTTSIPAVTAIATYGDYGTIDTRTDVANNAADVNSKGILLSVDSSAAGSSWKAGVRSGVLPLTTANTTINDLGLITLSFSMRASRANPVVVRLESYDAAGTTRTGGLSKLIYPATPNYYQRFAIDLSTMTPDGAGTFVPTATKIQVTYELDSTAGGDGWPAAAGLTLKIDNLNYATPAWYVATNGADNTSGGRGTTASLTFLTANYAMSLAQPGDIIVVRGGTYNSGISFRRYVPATNSYVMVIGAPDAWVVLKNYPGETPVIRSKLYGTISFGMNNYTGPANAYLEIRGMTTRGYATVDANGDRDLDPAVGSLQALLGKGGEVNCNGIGADGRTMTNLMHDIRIADNVTEYETGGGIGVARVDKILIENNISRYNSWWTGYGSSGFSTLVPADFENNSDYRAVLQNNQSYGNETMAPAVGNDLRFTDGNGIIIDINRNAEAGFGPDLAYRGRTLVQNNLVYNNGGSGIHAFNAQNVDIVHNTAYLNSASPRLEYPQIFAGYSKNVNIRDNILVAPDNPSGDSTRNEPFISNGSQNVSGTIFYQNNLFYGLGNNITAPAGHVLTPAGNFTPNTTGVDPLFVAPSRNVSGANFRLRSTSPALNIAAALSYRSGLDITGRPRLLSSATADVGVYQTQPNTVFSPILTPAPANYLTAQSVVLSSSTSGATLVYTTNGTTPTVNASGVPINGTVYTAPIPVSVATTVRAIAWKSGLTTSDVSGGDYTFVNSTAVPIPDLLFYPDAGTYVDSTLTGIICRTPGALVRYTTNGTDPTPTTGTLATAAMVNITSRTTLKAIAYFPGRPNSPVKTGDFTITGSYGNVSAGTVLETLGANKMRLSRFTADSSNSLTTVYARVSGAGNYRVAIYGDTDANADKIPDVVPGPRLATSTAAVTNPATGWISFTLSSSVAVVKNTNYWIAIWSDNAAAKIYADPTGGAVVDPTASATYGSWPNPVSTTATSASNPGYQYALYAIPANTAPIVTIPTAPATVTLPATASLTGASDDDGYPLIAGAPGYQWTETSGPGTVTFSAPTSLSTTASFSAAGTYVLRLTATDGRLSAFAEVSIDVASGAGSNPETVIYRETFGNAGATSLPLADTSIGWKFLQAVTTGANISDTSGSSSNGGVDFNNGRPADLNSVNAGASASAVTGYAYSLNVRQSLVYTTEFPINRSVYTPTALSWYSHISATNSGQNNQSPAVRIGGQWYVVTLSTATAGNLTQTGGGSSFNLSGSLFTFDFATATASSATGVTTTGWRTLTATSGGPFAIGASIVALPSGNIEAYGVYFTTAGASTARFDTFEVKSTLVPLATTTTLVSSSNPAAVGASVTLTATVSSISGTPSGTVTFFDGASNLGTGTIDGSGVATLSTSALAAGTHSLTASFTATPLYLTSTSAVLAQSVLHPTATAHASNLNPSNPGVFVSLTATVTSSGGTPSGTVTFFDGATNLGTGTLNGSGVATLSISTLAPGSHSLTASYTGSATYAASTSSALVQTVRHPTTTALTSTANPANPGAILTLTATVTSSGGTPGGTVTFSDGAAILGTGTLNGSGIATFDTSALASGPHSLTATFVTNTTYIGSTSALLAQTVRQPTTTVLTSSISPAAFGTLVTYTATVSSPFGTPSGTVTFLDGASIFGTVTLNGSGVATLDTASRPSGARSLTASYAASADHAASTSAILTQTINAGTPVWTGEGADGLYNNPANWAGVTVPAAAETALFANNVNTAVTLSSNQIFGALQFGGDTGSFTFSPGSAGVRFIGNASGSTLTVLNTVTGAPVLTLNPDLQLSQARSSSANFTITNNSPSSTLVLNGNITGAVSTPTLSNQFSLRGSGNAYVGSTIQLNGIISDGALGGNVAFTKTGGANQYSTAILTGANTYSGGTDFSVASGILALGHKSALGSGDIRLTTGGSGVIFRADANLIGVNAIANPVRYFGGLGASVSPAPTATSTVAGGFTFTVSFATGLAVGQVVSGSGIQLNSRITDISGLVVTISNPIALTGSNFTLTASAYNNSGGGLTVFSGANPIELSGPVFLTTANSNLAAATQNFRVDNAGGATFSGVLQQEAAAGLTKTGGESLTLSAANTYTGPTTVSDGSLFINGDQSAATGAIAVNGTPASSGNFTSTAGSNSISAGTTTGLIVGQSVVGPGIPASSFITGITNGTTFTIQVNAVTGAGTGLFSFGAATGTLGGNGRIGGPVSISAGGFLRPGPFANSIGLLEMKSSLQMNPASTTILEINGTTRGVTHDAIDITGAASYGGNLLLDVGTPLSAGTQLNLISAAGASGSFATVAITGAGHGAGSLANNGSGVWTGTVGSTVFSFDQASGTLAVAAESSLIAAWRNSQFGSLENTGDGANDADPDFDGITNLMEYATAGDPKHFNPSPATGSRSAGILQLTFNRIADPGLIYEVQGCSDLQNWTLLDSSTGAENTAGSVTIPDSPPPEASKRYMRLKVILK